MQRALGRSERESFRVEIDESHIRVGTDARIGAADLDFGASIIVGKNTVARTERVIQISLPPVLRPGRLDGNVAVDNREAPGLLGRVVVLCAGWNGKQHQANRDGQQKSCKGE